MNSITIGPLSIPTEVLTGLLALVAGFASVSVYTRETPGERKQFNDRLLTGVIIFVLLWKIGPAVTDFESVSRQPMLVLYAPSRPLHLVIAGIGFLLYGLRVYFADGKNRRLFFAFLLFLAVSAGVFSFIRFVLPVVFPAEEPAVAEVVPPAPGRPATDFTAQTLDGTEVSLSDYRGVPVVLNFWATWCPPCKAEIPELVRFYDQGVGNAVLLTVNLTATERDIVAVQSFLLQKEIEFPVLLDVDGSIANLYAVESIPTTFLINAEGIITHIHGGAVTKSWLEQRLDD